MIVVAVNLHFRETPYLNYFLIMENCYDHIEDAVENFVKNEMMSGQLEYDYWIVDDPNTINKALLKEKIKKEKELESLKDYISILNTNFKSSWKNIKCGENII
jgi:hypothetical protein